MLLHNSLNSVQTQAGAFSNSLGGKKRFKYMGLDIRWNSGTVIANLNHHTPAVAISVYPKFAPAVHRIDGIVNDVGPNLIQLTAERIHEKRHRVVITLDFHAALELV